MQNPVLIRRKLTSLVQYLKELQTLAVYSFDEYRENHLIRRSAERLIQLAVEVAADINGHLIVGAGGKPPASYYESFVMLAQLKILDKDLAHGLAPTTGLRNRLVHEYDVIEDETVFRNVASLPNHFRRYIAGVESFLGKGGD